MKVYSSKKAALNSLPPGDYKSMLYCTGEYKTSIKTIEKPSESVKALYKSYRSKRPGERRGHVKLYCIKAAV